MSALVGLRGVVLAEWAKKISSDQASGCCNVERAQAKSKTKSKEERSIPWYGFGDGQIPSLCVTGRIFEIMMMSCEK